MQKMYEVVHAQVEKVINADLIRPQYGWGELVGLALCDAVFSIRSKYEAQDPTKGVIGRLRSLKEAHEPALADLHETAQIPEAELIRIMGGGKTSGRTKASAVIEAAEKLSAAGLRTCEQTRERPAAALGEYRTVKGLGPVTAEYFLMLVGVPGVKADIQITAFVNDALANSGLPPVDGETAGSVIKQIHEAHYASNETFSDLRLFDNAIWRYQSTLEK